MTATATNEALEIDWDQTCEKCLGKMERRRINYESEKKLVLQCVRCKFFTEIRE